METAQYKAATADTKANLHPLDQSEYDELMRIAADEEAIKVFWRNRVGLRKAREATPGSPSARSVPGASNPTVLAQMAEIAADSRGDLRVEIGLDGSSRLVPNT